MLQPLERRVLRRHTCFDTPDDARGFVAAVARHSRPGMVFAVCLDRRRRLVDFHCLPGAHEAAEIVRVVQRCGHHRTCSLLLLSDRSDEPVVSRPDDELTWEELCGQADAAGLALLDWWVLTGRHAYSVAELTPTPAGW